MHPRDNNDDNIFTVVLFRRVQSVKIFEQFCDENRPGTAGSFCIVDLFLFGTRRVKIPHNLPIHTVKAKINDRGAFF